MDTAIKYPIPDWVKQLFVIFDIQALWCSALSVRVLGCQKLQMFWDIGTCTSLWITATWLWVINAEYHKNTRKDINIGRTHKWHDTRKLYDTRVGFWNKPNLYRYLKPAFHDSHPSVVIGNGSYPFNGIITEFVVIRSQFVTGRIPYQNWSRHFWATEQRIIQKACYR